MASNGDNLEAKRARAKLDAMLRAERRLHNRLNDIDWQYDVLIPAREKFDQQLLQGIIPEFTLVEDNDKTK